MEGKYDENYNNRDLVHGVDWMCSSASRTCPYPALIRVRERERERERDHEQLLHSLGTFYTAHVLSHRRAGSCVDAAAPATR
jgi:hypothetical protein